MAGSEKAHPESCWRFFFAASPARSGVSCGTRAARALDLGHGLVWRREPRGRASRGRGRYVRGVAGGGKPHLQNGRLGSDHGNVNTRGGGAPFLMRVALTFPLRAGRRAAAAIYALLRASCRAKEHDHATGTYRLSSEGPAHRHSITAALE